jgi:hypothetical protein
MTLANNVLTVSELDFDLIKQNMLTFFQNQDKFKDYDFTGSSLNILMDILAYNTHYLNWYSNMVGNEAFLDSAILRNNIVSRAKHLGYVPGSSRGAQANVDITITPPGGDPTSTLSLPQYTTFQSESIDDVNYTFVNTDALTVSKNTTSNTFTFTGVTLTQGEPFTYTFTVDNTNLNSRFIIPDANIDTSTLIVSVVQIGSPTVVYEQFEDLAELTSNSTVYFLEAADEGQYAIRFGDGNIGVKLISGDSVVVNYLSTSGPLAEKANVFTTTSPIGGFSNVIVSTNDKAAGGIDTETNDSIRFSAPIYYTAQNRAVTILDFSIILKDFPVIDQVNAWGGEDNDPVAYGKVFISLKPKQGYALTNIEKQRIIDTLVKNRNVVGITPVIVDPNYLFVLINTKVYFNQKDTNKVPSTISSMVYSSITDYANTNFGSFNSSLLQSKMQSAIDNSEQSITNDEVTIYLQKRISPTLNVSNTYTISYNNPIRIGTISDKFYTYPSFQYTDNFGIDQPNCYIEEIPFSESGIYGYKIISGGTGFTKAPDLVINGDGSGASATVVIEDGTIISIEPGSSGTDYTVANISIVGDGTGADILPLLTQNKGQLRIIYYKDDGSKIVVDDNCGDIDYLNGKITIKGFNPVNITTNSRYDEGILTFNIPVATQTAQPAKNTILTLDTKDSGSVQINVVPND